MPAKKRQQTHTRKRVAAKATSTSRLRPKPLAKVAKSKRRIAPKRLPARAAAHPAPEPPTPRFLEVTPSLAVADVARSRVFYQRLGFRVTAQLPPTGRPEWLRLERDGVALLVWNEVVAAPDVLAAIRQARGAGNALRITVSDIDRLLREFQESGVILHRRLETMPDGSREFGVVDPDGFHLEFVNRPVLGQDAPARLCPQTRTAGLDVEGG
jgi:catechol 2,3-dioxygenase-like lactoylglutathione lyase family enzyme